MLEKLLQGFGVNDEGDVFVNVALDYLDDVRGDVLRFLPVLLIPGLELGDVAGRPDLDVEFDVLREARDSEIAGAHQGDGADDSYPGVGDVGFGVEFAFGVNAALNLALLHGLNDGRRAGQEIV